MVLGNGLCFSRSISTAQTTQDETSLLVAAHFGEPPRRLWKEPDCAEKDEQRDDLKRDGEAPCYGRVAIVHEGQTEFKPISYYDTENVQAMSFELDTERHILRSRNTVTGVQNAILGISKGYGASPEVPGQSKQVCAFQKLT